jgi:signal transduction histidine kinase
VIAAADPSPPASPRPVRPASIRNRLANALALWSVVWGLAVGAAVWLAAAHEVDEMLDDTLVESTDLIAGLVESRAPDPPSKPGGAVAPVRGDRLAWQVRTVQGELALRSARAPDAPWPVALGLGQAEGWRTHAVLLPNGQILVVAQSLDERSEARSEVALGAVLAALAIGLLGHVWLRARVTTELQPLADLSKGLEAWDIDADPRPPDVGASSRRELVPVQSALAHLADRLATRLSDERAFSAHAAHALRTPLAGIDAQLAVALRESPAELRPRLQRVRDAATRLQGVVAALIGLFRAGSTVQRAEVDLSRLVARLPTPTLQVEVQPGPPVWADADLLAAALANLLDNAQRQGARRAWLATGLGNVVHLSDDGPGLSAQARQALLDALDRPGGGEPLGLGLLLADRVARVHGGRLRLPGAGPGFRAELDLGPSPWAPEVGSDAR